MNRSAQILEFTKNARRQEKCEKWRHLEALARGAVEDAEKAKLELIEACDNENFEGFGVKVSLIERKGSVDYTQIPELSGIDLEQYRKAGTSYWAVKPSVKE